MSRNNKEDDEDELEALRLAALESLRAKGLPPPVTQGQHVSPKPNVCSNAVCLASQALFYTFISTLILYTQFYSVQVFQRHFGNQNLIAIIPVENNSASSSPYQNSSPHHPPLHGSKSPPVKNNSSRPPLLKNPPIASLISQNSPVEEKRSNKFSRFEDSDSDESDDVEMSYAKSESEEEEFVIEEGDAEDLIIEVEDEIIEEIEEESNGVTEFSPAVAKIPEERVNVATSGAKPSEKSASPSGPINTSTPPVKITMADSAKEVHAPRDIRHVESNRKIDTGDFARRSPQLSNLAARSPNPHSRRRSPSRQQRSPQRMQKSSPRPHRSPPRSQRSPVRAQRSPVRIQRSPSRVQRSPPRVQRSPPHRRSPLRSSDKVKDRGTSKTSSGSDRSVPDDSKKTDKKRMNTSVESLRSSEQRRTGDKSRSPTCERKPLLKRSPPRSISNERDSRKLVTPSLTETERDRLESRKRKFETAPDQESSVKKEGKIRLRTEMNRKTPPVQLKRREEKLVKKSEAVVEQIQVRRDEPISSVPDKTDDEDVDKKSKKSKRPTKKSKDKSRNGKTQSGSDGDNGNCFSLTVFDKLNLNNENNFFYHLQDPLNL